MRSYFKSEVHKVWAGRFKEIFFWGPVRSDYKSEIRPSLVTRFKEIFFTAADAIVIPRLAVMTLFIIVMSGIATAQELPPRPIVVTPTSQSLSFGAFTPGASGGTVTVTPGSMRTSSGTVVLLNLGFSATSALFDITANPGTLISILNPLPVVLAGSGGGSMTLTISGTSPASPFVTSAVPPLTTTLDIGGILNVGDILSNPPGSYTGTFNITFIQE